MKQSHPPCLLSNVLQNRIVLRGQNPDTLLFMSTAKGQLRSDSISFFVRALLAAQSSMMYKVGSAANSPLVIVEPFSRVDDVDLGVCPYPWLGLVCFDVPHGWTEDDYVPEGATVDALKEIECKDAARFSTDYGRVGVFGQVSIAPTRNEMASSMFARNCF